MSVRVDDLVAPGIRALSAYEPGKPIEEVERELGPLLPAGGVIELASNENPLGPSRALEAIRAALPGIHRYPDGGSRTLRRALADHYHRFDVREEEVAIGNGSNEILDLLVPMSRYGLPHHLRVTIGAPDENRRLLGALTVALGLA
jgi:histidinol-phosphate aminotransferase